MTPLVPPPRIAPGTREAALAALRAEAPDYKIRIAAGLWLAVSTTAADPEPLAAETPDRLSLLIELDHASGGFL